PSQNLRKMPRMKKDDRTHQEFPPARIGGLALLSTALLWMAQPPWMLWPLSMIALVPLLPLVITSNPISRRGYVIIWMIMTLYWLVSLQGLRHAHWAMYFCWIALAAYLAVFPLWFLFAARWMVTHRVPLFLAVATAWTGQECLRNYLLTGISACMLGHALADVPALIQIADLFGSYGVSFLLAAINAALFQAIRLLGKEAPSRRELLIDGSAALLMLAASLIYGRATAREPSAASSPAPLGTFALVQRSEPVEYAQEAERELEMFRAYAAETISAMEQADGPVDAIVWPESMFTAANPWMIADADAKVPAAAAANMTPIDLQRAVAENREYFSQRAKALLDAVAASRPGAPRPSLIVGSGVVHYRQQPEVYCGIVNIDPQAKVQNWYGKMHLVMFGEYIPLLPYIPGLRSLVPPELGLKTGSGPQRFLIGDTVVSPNICIETAVERVTVNQLRSLRRSGQPADLIITVTNDGWFDESSVIDHHRRCAQLVAVGCRRPILSAANNGPTAWIDSRGQVVEQLETGSSGVVMAKPLRDARTSLYLRIGDWPARCCAAISLLPLISLVRRRGKEASGNQKANAADEAEEDR
ncbi:MAG: apolipoprotein N-acyltransferase, partial [Planctomycetes bacterium]|nr:apolipoprotein N-acyltransferase [Planctomycetota bacterium]